MSNDLHEIGNSFGVVDNHTVVGLTSPYDSAVVNAVAQEHLPKSPTLTHASQIIYSGNVDSPDSPLSGGGNRKGSSHIRI